MFATLYSGVSDDKVVVEPSTSGRGGKERWSKGRSSEKRSRRYNRASECDILSRSGFSLPPSSKVFYNSAISLFRPPPYIPLRRVFCVLCSLSLSLSLCLLSYFCTTCVLVISLLPLNMLSPGPNRCWFEIGRGARSCGRACCAGGTGMGPGR